MKERYDDLDEYIADLQAEIAQSENCANHYYQLGMAMLAKKDYSEAEDAFLNSVRLSPRLAEGFIQLGGLCLQKGDYEGCLRYNEEASNIRAKYAVPQANIGFCHLQLGNVKKAKTALNKALTWDEGFLQARTTLASAYFMEENYDECIVQSMKVIRQEPNFAPAWNNLALAYFEKGEYEKADDAVKNAQKGGYEVPAAFLVDLEAKLA